MSDWMWWALAVANLGSMTVSLRIGKRVGRWREHWLEMHDRCRLLEADTKAVVEALEKEHCELAKQTARADYWQTRWETDSREADKRETAPRAWVGVDSRNPLASGLGTRAPKKGKA